MINTVEITHIKTKQNKTTKNGAVYTAKTIIIYQLPSDSKQKQKTKIQNKFTVPHPIIKKRLK